MYHMQKFGRNTKEFDIQRNDKDQNTGLKKKIWKKIICLAIILLPQATNSISHLIYFWWNKVWHSYIAPAWHQREAKMSSKIWLAFTMDSRTKMQTECLKWECWEGGILPFASCWVEEHCCFLQWHCGTDQLVAKSLKKEKKSRAQFIF